MVPVRTCLAIRSARAVLLEKTPAAQAVNGVVGNSHGLFIAVVFDDADHRSEDFFLGDAHRVVHIGKDGGGVIEAALDAFDLDPLAAGDELRPFLFPDLDIPFNRGQLRRVDQGTQVGVGQKLIADP